MKLCINCEHWRPPEFSLPIPLPNEGYAQCHHPRFVSMVTGKLEPRNCKVQRESSLKDYCGPEAKFFESTKCEKCDSHAVEGEELCADCEQNRAEAAYERSQEEGFRGGEASAHFAEQQEQARALK